MATAMSIHICRFVLLRLPPCVLQSEVEVMLKRPWYPLTFLCLACAASHDLMFSLKHLIIRAPVCVCVCCLRSFMCTCITAAALFTAAPSDRSVCKPVYKL